MLKKVKRIKLGIQAYRRIVKRVLERDGWRCQKCGALENLQVHHRIKRSQQGNDSLENLVTLCAYCHMAEHDHLGFAGKATQTAKESLAKGRLQGRRAELFVQTLTPSMAHTVKAGFRSSIF